ncbi:MAG: class I SAM-dependent methyltransferase [Thermoplasmatota archaeon]
MRSENGLSYSFDRVADKFDETRFYPDTVMGDILNALEKVLVKGSRTLDAGVGTGRFAEPLQKRGYDVVGVDISPRMLDNARGKGTENLFRGDLCALPFRDAVFSVAISIHVLHLISSWRCALGEIGRVTTDRFLSVAFNKEESPAEAFRLLYERVCEENGFEIHHPGMRERELPDLLPADRVSLIDMHEHTMEVPKLLDGYENRIFSSQWTVPDEIHEIAMEAMHEKYDGVDQVFSIERISLLEWSMDRVRSYAAGR